MKIAKWLNYTLFTLVTLSAFYCIFVVVALAASITEPQENKQEMISYPVYWARLADIPEEAENVIVIAEGSSFTRSYKGCFFLKQQALEQWIAMSPGLQEAQVTDISEDENRYVIEPKKAIYASVTINFKIGKVKFEAIWS